MKCILSFEHYRNVIQEFSPYMNDYLFVYDMKEGLWYISPSAVDRFKLTVNETHSSVENNAVTERVVYGEDLAELRRDMAEMFREHRETHDLIYRWVDKEDRPVWINCRMHARYDGEGNPTICIGLKRIRASSDTKWA